MKPHNSLRAIVLCNIAIIVEKGTKTWLGDLCYLSRVLIKTYESHHPQLCTIIQNISVCLESIKQMFVCKRTQRVDGMCELLSHNLDYFEWVEGDKRLWIYGVS